MNRVKIVEDRRFKATDAIAQIPKDCIALRSKASVPSPILKDRDLVELDKVVVREGHELKLPYAHYEIGHYFFTEHILASVKQKLDISDEEEKLIRTLIGPLHYNPPQSHYGEKAAAATQLMFMGQRGAEIYAACRSVSESLLRTYEQAEHELYSSTFCNPTFNLETLADWTLDRYGAFYAEMAVKRDYRSFYA